MQRCELVQTEVHAAPVEAQMAGLSELVIAEVATVRAFARVDSPVFGHIAGMTELSNTEVAFVRRLARMTAPVFDKIAAVSKFLSARLA